MMEKIVYWGAEGEDNPTKSELHDAISDFVDGLDYAEKYGKITFYEYKQAFVDWEKYLSDMIDLIDEEYGNTEEYDQDQNLICNAIDMCIPILAESFRVSRLCETGKKVVVDIDKWILDNETE